MLTSGERLKNDDVMKSPFTGKEMNLVSEKRIWKFRGEEYGYIHTSWLCPDTGERFTTDEMDDVAFVQVTNQYRAKYGIPFTDEIISVREKYDVSAAKMSLILGMGTNQWRLYETGEVPSVSNGRMIRSIKDPQVFEGYVHSSKNLLEEKEYQVLLSKIAKCSPINEDDYPEQYGLPKVFQCERGAENGYARQSLMHLKNILLYILNQTGEVFCTKMNKLLFYADFLSYRRYGVAMTGLSYRAIDFGPVPERWDRVYSYFEEIIQEPRSFGDKEGNVLMAVGKAEGDRLTSEEKSILDEVCARFISCTSSEMTRLSHEEDAWCENVEGHRRIPFDTAFKLKAI